MLRSRVGHTKHKLHQASMLRLTARSMPPHAACHRTQHTAPLMHAMLRAHPFYRATSLIPCHAPLACCSKHPYHQATSPSLHSTRPPGCCPAAATSARHASAIASEPRPPSPRTCGGRRSRQRRHAGSALPVRPWGRGRWGRGHRRTTLRLRPRQVHAAGQPHPRRVGLGSLGSLALRRLLGRRVQ